MVFQTSGCNYADAANNSSLLSGGRVSCVSAELTDYTNDNGMCHGRGHRVTRRRKARSHAGAKRSKAHPVGEQFLASERGAANRSLRRALR